MTFEFTEQEAQVILDSLAAQPYRAVAGVIQKMFEQSKAQQQPVVAEPAPTAKTPSPLSGEADCVRERAEPAKE